MYIAVLSVLSLNNLERRNISNILSNYRRRINTISSVNFQTWVSIKLFWDIPAH